ncbi:hypothetical protein COHA_010685 [Chlorella ohadii]|uniref:Uncharacterized protein n=1 Tax=Chlorella ohadii TaxID=2649997 RepID=A0AAD5DFU6_9CHLO|nr:hypothetical protein COHA_010685 [Chlorella ohadii]
MQALRAALLRAAAAEGSAVGGPLGIIIECDGALIDAHGEGHRVAFNRAFAEIGHDCTNWSPAVFYDLMRLGDGTGEGVIAAYYNIRGWPMMLASSERGAFLKNVHNMKVRILREMAAKGEVPLRQGAAQFLDDALAEGAQVAVVAATASVPEDGLISSAMFNLGPNRAFQLRVVTMGGGSSEGGEGGSEAAGGQSEGEEGAPAGATFEQQVAAAQARKKAEAAKEFVRVYNLQKASGMGMAVDPKIMTAAERAGKLTPQLMAAISATLDTPAAQTMVVAGGNTLMEAGKSAGMLTLGVPPSVAQRGGFSAADALFDGYGPGGGLTWHKAKLMLQKHQDKLAAAQQQGRQG